MATDAFVLKSTFEEQIAFFRQKLNLPTARWDDIWQAAHDRFFIVAGAQSADLLADLRSAVDKTIAEGKSINWFRKNFDAIVAKNGWSGFTGSGSKAGIAWRTRVIHVTNGLTSYAAGRWEQLNDPGLLKFRPYWRYVHKDGVAHPRPLHVSWHGLTLPHDHYFWKTHFPPNGWFCHCSVYAASKREYDAAVANGRGPEAAPAEGDTTGIDPGFEYAPGANRLTPVHQMIDKKLVNLEAPIGAAMMQVLGPVLKAEMETAYRNWLSTLDTNEVLKSVTPIIGAVSLSDIEWLKNNGKPVPQTAEIGISSGVVNGPKAIRHAAQGDAIPIQIWENLPGMIADPLAVLYDQNRGTLLYVLPDPSARHPQLVVEFDFMRKTKTEMNMIVSGYRPLLDDLRSRIANGTVLLMRGNLE